MDGSMVMGARLCRARGEFVGVQMDTPETINDLGWTTI